MQVAIGIDVGLRLCGVGIAGVQTSALPHETNPLLHACLVKNPELEDDAARAWIEMANAVRRETEAALAQLADQAGEWVRVAALVIERQAIRGGGERGMMTKNPGAVLGLASIVGALLVLLPGDAKKVIYPSQWNRGLKKDESTARVWGELDSLERSRVHGAGRSKDGTGFSRSASNVVDAAGIAKWAAMKAAQGAIRP